jgi:hypothetical protein
MATYEEEFNVLAKEFKSLNLEPTTSLDREQFYKYLDSKVLFIIEKSL